MENSQSEDNHQTTKVIPLTRTIKLPKPIPRLSKNPIIRKPESNLSFLSYQKERGDGNRVPFPIKQSPYHIHGLNIRNSMNFDLNLFPKYEKRTESKTESPDPSNQQNTILKKGHKSTKNHRLIISSFGNYFSQQRSYSDRIAEKRSSLNLAMTYNFSYKRVNNNKVTIPNEALFLKKRTLDEFGLTEFSILHFSNNRNQHVLKHFKCVYQGLLLLFTESSLQLDFGEFDPLSFELFASIVERKFKVYLGSPDNRESIKKLKSVLSLKQSNKRPEECKKIIFSLTIKSLKNKLRNNCKRSYRKKAFESYFYNHYFSEIAKKEHIPITDFYYPVSYNKNKKNAYKTINKSYLGNIKKSKKFVRDFNGYMNHHLIEDYKKEIGSRLLETVSKWDHDYIKYRNSTKLKEKFQVYFQNEKSKLPWTINDIQFAIKTVKTVLRA